MAPFFLLILLIPLHLRVNSQDLSSEKAVLLSMKQQWGDPPSLDSWNSTSIPCDWPEVKCMSDAVIALKLAGKGINGTIPSSICQLKNLVSINLSQNNLSGHIPVSLHNCTKLERLDLSFNALSGKIPGECLRMKRLRHLLLNGNRLVGEIPTPIEAVRLDYLNLSDNQLNGSIPYDIRNLYNLLELDLSMNLFSGKITMELFQMRRMYYLSLGFNSISGQLPAQMNLSRLQVLNLTHNQINGTLPESLDKSTRLSTLDLPNNQISGEIGENVLRLSSMKILNLCSNKFLGKIPNEFVNQHFRENCFDLSNLCSDNRTEGLPSCPSALCSDHRIQGFVQCNSKHDNSEKHFVILTVIAVGCGAVGFAILFYLVRKCWLKRAKKIWPSNPSLKDEEEWKMLSFQRLKFDKRDILSGLTDENLIGNGGSGKVYLVSINQTSDAVAVKSILNPQKSDRVLEKEFLAEIQTLGTIWHNNIVKLLCYISGKKLKLLVYKYLEHKSLDQWLHGNNREISSLGENSATKLDWPMRLHIAIGAAQGLCYMHHDCSPPIIHRDVKSRNILLDSQFNAKIADFGLSKLLTRRGDTETASTVTGTFGYIAPEYAYTAKVNTKTDVYSFGVVLLELTTRREAVTKGDHMNLAERARLLYGDTTAILEALDGEIKDSMYSDQIITVFRLGVIYTATSPSNRPSMKDCLHILQNCKNNSSCAL